MKESISEKRNHASLVRSEQLEKLWMHLAEHVGTVIATAECADNVEREFDDLKELLKYENAKARRIVDFSVKSGSYSRKYVNIRFSSENGIQIEIKAQGRVDAELKEKIYDILADVKPWYAFLAPRVFPSDRIVSDLIYLLIGVGVYIGLLIVLSEIAVRLVSLDRASKSTQELFAVSLLGVTAFFMWVLNRLRVHIFPLCCFALGQGERRYEISERVRWGFIFVLLGSLVSVLVSLI